jgi:hypothetical protein
MSYIVTLKRRISSEKIGELVNSEVFISKLLPIIIVEEYTDKLFKADFVESIRESDVG